MDRIKSRKFASCAISCLAFALCAAGAAFLALSCRLTGPDDSRSPKAGSLRVSVSPAGQARSIRPGFDSEIDSVDLRLSLAGGTTEYSKTFDSATAYATFENLEKGTWTIAATARKAGVEIGSGTASAVVGGSAQSIVVPIRFIAGSGTVDFSIPVTWPDAPPDATGVDFAAMSLDGGTAVPLAVGAPSGGFRTATISLPGLSVGAHRILLSFKRGGTDGTAAGSFVEYVNVYSGYASYVWIGNDGAPHDAWTFAATDFLDSNASLAGLALTVDGTPADIGFSSAEDSYDLAIGVGTSLRFTPTRSVDGQSISYGWNAPPSPPITSGVSSESLSLGNQNTLTVNVVAPDRATTKTYTLTVRKTGTANVTFTLNPEYRAFSFSPSASLAHGAPTTVRFTCAAGDVASSGTDWVWYVDGTPAASGASVPTYDALLPSAGAHSVSCCATLGGVRYSGTALVTVVNTSLSPWYDGNGATTGYGPDHGSQSVGEAYTVWDNTTNPPHAEAFARPGFTMAGWNTRADGSGTAYAKGQEIVWGVYSDMTFFAQWQNVAPAKATSLAVSVNDSERYAIVTWTNPADVDLDYVVAQATKGIETKTVRVSRGTLSCLFAGLGTGTWTFSVIVHDDGGLQSDPLSMTVAVPAI